jgi:hypothetical protein
VGGGGGGGGGGGDGWVRGDAGVEALETYEEALEVDRLGVRKVIQMRDRR